MGKAKRYREKMEGMARVHAINIRQMVMDPDGDNPPCKNAVGGWLCEDCGQDVRHTKGACPSVPREKRWRIDCEAIRKAEDNSGRR